MAEAFAPLQHLTAENRALLDLALERDRLYREAPEQLFPILLRCRVRVLLVADGGLDFSLGDFGLRAFVDTLRTTAPYYVRFELTLAHMDNVTDAQVMAGHAGIARSIKRFKFDDPAHFRPDLYDQVWLFGIRTATNRGNDPAGQPYPPDRLSDRELRALSEFMNGGGGLFATGDHGFLGRCLGGAVPRARSMRRWGDTSPDDALNEVSMGGPRRNDTNRLGGSIGSQFNDQSDDVPQAIQPRLYRLSPWVWWRAAPHPLLCGPRGVIRVLPDHPHEGECVEPANTGRSDTFAGFAITEYPAGAGGSPRPLPQVIATSTVLAGTVSGTKQPTQPHAFGAICAYDGHRAGVGRVVTDATWHHFVNVNLVGDSGAPSGDPKRLGFLATPGGQAHLENVKAYYRNLAVWLSPPASIRCMNRRISWGLLWNHRVLEAVLTHTEVSLQRARVGLLLEIGRHAQDVLGHYASQCRSLELVLDLVRPHLNAALLERLDPWAPPPERRAPEPDPLPWVDAAPLLDVALGGALLALREAFPDPDPDALEEVDRALDEVVERGAKTGVDLALRSLVEGSAAFSALATGTPQPPPPRPPRRASRAR